MKTAIKKKKKWQKTKRKRHVGIVTKASKKKKKKNWYNLGKTRILNSLVNNTEPSPSSLNYNNCNQQWNSIAIQIS